MLIEGRPIRVDPVGRPEDIAPIKQIISEIPGEMLLFAMSSNDGLRLVDLLKLKVKDVKSLKAGEFITI